MVERMQTPGKAQASSSSPSRSSPRDEIGRLAEAFNTVNEVTVRVAKEQAALRASIAEMFVNVARRNQVLLGRQLSQLDKMEAREEDPDVLTASSSSTTWPPGCAATRRACSCSRASTPPAACAARCRCPTSSALRSARSRHTTASTSSVTDDPDVSGRHALSVAHLLAELLENATLFSNPDTRVVVSAAMTGHGVDVTITDYGLGMCDDEIADANDKIAHPPVAEIAVSQRLGLFVVGRIAARLGATVELRRGRTAGTVVTVALPTTGLRGDGRPRAPGRGGRGAVLRPADAA